MTDPSRACQWIDLFHCDDPRDVVLQAVACLAQGGVVGLATETVYCLTASALQSESVDRLRTMSSTPDRQALALLLKGAEEATDWVPGISPTGRRLAWRLWPGPMILAFPPEATDGLFTRLPAEVRQLIAPEGSLALQNSSDPFIRDILELTPAPLVLAPLSRGDRGNAASSDSLRGLDSLDMVIDSGPTHSGGLPTWVRLTGDDWRIEREGAIDDRTLRRMSGLIILFICTGNTCRSPMAEAICKLVLARKRDCPLDQLEERGYFVLSAGVAAINGAPAAGHAVEILRSMGGSLESHRSRKVTFDLVRQADCIFAMTSDHLETLLDAVPGARANTFLLDPAGGDIPDPIGSDLQVYRHTAQVIERMLEEQLSRMGF